MFPNLFGEAKTATLYCCSAFACVMRFSRFQHVLISLHDSGVPEFRVERRAGANLNVCLTGLRIGVGVVMHTRTCGSVGLLQNASLQQRQKTLYELGRLVATMIVSLQVSDTRAWIHLVLCQP